MAKWLFVRHAQSQYNAGLSDKFNSEITSKGLDQAIRTAVSLIETTKNGGYIGHVSPYTRCLQTAQHIQKYTNINFNVCPLLGESPEEVHRGMDCRIYKAEDKYPEFRWSVSDLVHDYTGETESTYYDRIIAYVTYLKSNLDRNVITVSHMSPIVRLIRELCFGGERELFTIGNCSVTLIENFKPVFIGKMV